MKTTRVSLFGVLIALNLSAASESSALDFAGRCAQPGVVKCVSFDSPSDLNGTYGSNSGVLTSSTAPSIDTSLKASGNGSLKFFIPAGNPGAAAGSYFTNFSDDLMTQFGENSEFYVQYRVRMTPEFIAAGGFKTSIIGTGDQPGCTASTSAGGQCYASCTTLEVVVQTNTYGYPMMYNSCGASAAHGPYDAFQTGIEGYDYLNQNARAAPYCTYHQTIAGTQFPPTGNCFAHFPDEWMTFQVHIKTGPRIGDIFADSHVDFWMAREGQPAEPVIDWGPYSLNAGGLEDQKYGKVWLLPYSGTSPFPANSYVWYDELIISRNKIADPDEDKTAPTVTIISPTNGSSVTL
jgi:hypothetical protein